MTDQSDRIVKKLWSYCQVLRDDGLSYQDYLEQLTFLLFLKMADERAALTGEPQAIPAGFRWVDLANPKMEGVKLEQHYRDTLRRLGEQGGMLGLIFRKSQNKIQDPAKLRRLIVDLIDRESWMTLDADVKGGNAISLSYIMGRPVTLVGTGQGYDDLEPFQPQTIVRNLVGGD